MTDLDILEQFGKYFNQRNIVVDGLRTIMWLIMRFLMFISELVEDSFNQMFQWLNFSLSETITEIIDNPTTRTLIITVTVFALAFSSFILIFNRKKIDLSQLPTNILIFVFTMIGLPTILGLGNYMFTDVRSFIGTNGNTATESIIIQNITDLRYLDQTLKYNSTYLDDKGNIKTVGNYISGKKNASKIIKSISPNELVKFDDELLTKDIYKNKVSYDSDGTAILTEIGSTKGQFMGYTLYDFTSYYYRYTIDWFPLLLSLIGIVIAFAFASFKVVKIAIEITGQRLLAPIFAGATITSQQKTKQILTGILNSYIVLVYICLSIKLLYLGFGFSSKNFNPVLAGLSNFLVALATIDGPHWVERLFGIDAGLGPSAVKQLYYGAKSIAGLGKAAARGLGHIKNGADAMKSGLDRLSGFGQGISDGLRENEENAREQTETSNGSSEGKNQKMKDSMNPILSDQNPLWDQGSMMDESSPFDNTDVVGKDEVPLGSGEKSNPFNQPATEAQKKALQRLSGMSKEATDNLSKGEASQMLQQVGLDKSYWDGLSKDDFDTQDSPTNSPREMQSGGIESHSDESASGGYSQPGLASEIIDHENSERKTEATMGIDKVKPKPSIEKSLRDSTKIEKYRIDMTKQGKDMKGRPSLDTRRDKSKKIKQSNKRIGYNMGQLIARKIKKRRGK